VKRGKGLFLRSLLLVLSLAGAVLAQSYEAALLDGVAARDRALETGDQRDWQRALQHFERAVELQPSKEAQFELAEAAAQLGLVARAYAAYEAALALGLQGKARARAEDFLGARQGQVARLEVVGPSGAQLWVDDQRRGSLPLSAPLVVAPGELRVRLEQPDFQTRELRVQATAAGLARVAIELTPVAAAPAAPPSVHAHADARAPWAVPTLITGGALAVAGVATFTASSLLLSGARHDLAALCDLPDPDDGDRCLATAPERRGEAQSAANRVLTYGNLRWVGVAGAALGVGAAVVGWLGLASGETPEPAQAALELSPERASLVWRGRF
jgi:hypothetical protein